MKQSIIDRINNDIKASGFTKQDISLQISTNRCYVYNFLRYEKLNVEALKAIYKIIDKDYKDIL